MVKTKNDFRQRVWRACRRIPRSRVTTYGEIARAVGKPRASRAVGNALNASPGMPGVPCHRVVKADCTIGGFAKGTKTKIALLAKEGVKIRKGKILDFQRARFTFSLAH